MKYFISNILFIKRFSWLKGFSYKMAVAHWAIIYWDDVGRLRYNIQWTFVLNGAKRLFFAYFNRMIDTQKSIADVAYSIRRKIFKESPNLLHTLFISPFAQLSPFAPVNFLTANSAKRFSVIFFPIVIFSIAACVDSCICIRVISSPGGFLSESNTHNWNIP